MTIENKYLLGIKKFLRQRNPKLLSIGAAGYYKAFKLQKEKAYLKGGLRSSRKDESLLLLSCNRAATQLVEEVLRIIYEKGGGQYIALNRYLFFCDKDAKKHIVDVEYMSGLMKHRGFFYGQQGPFDNHVTFRNYKLVLMSRDPRDLLVSHFFSLSQAHIPKNKDFVKRIRNAQEMGIQKYVLLEENVSYYRKSLEQVITLRKKPNTLFWKYEDMMDDFFAFQEACQLFVNESIDTELSIELNSLYKKPAESSNVDNTRHRRSGAWGQFKTALEPDVIHELNEQFRDILESLEYPLDA